jgi:hypothetical protein
MLERYNPILNAIRDLSPTAHIAGGAVRDTLLERPIKDIDLFLDNSATDEAAKLMRKHFGFVMVGNWESYDGGFSDRSLARVAKFEKADEETPVCLIGLQAPSEWHDYDEPQPFGRKANLNRFDFGICQAGWDGETVYTSAAYKIDVEQKSFTVCRSDNQAQFDYTMSRFEKMTKERYAGWQLKVPAEFETLLAEHTFKRTYYRDFDTGELKFREGRAKSILIGPKAR